MWKASKRRITFIGLLVFICSAAMVIAAAAPVGTYTATIGETGITAGAKMPGQGARKVVRPGRGAAEGRTVSINVTSYSTKSELDALKAAEGNPQEFAKILSSFNHGSIQMGERSFPLNVATSSSAGGKYVILALSSKPFAATSPRNPSKAAGGASVGYIRLTVDEAGNGQGMMYSSTQVAMGADGEITGKMGASSATQLLDVTRQ